MFLFSFFFFVFFQQFLCFVSPNFISPETYKVPPGLDLMPPSRNNNKRSQIPSTASWFTIRSILLFLIAIVPSIFFALSHFHIHTTTLPLPERLKPTPPPRESKTETTTTTTTTTTPPPEIRRNLDSSGNIEWEVLDSYKHDRRAFTQGFHTGKNNIMYEGTGLFGRSELRKVEINTGKVLKRVKLDNSKFGEGITLLDDDTRVIQLTWKSRTGYVWDTETFEQLQTFQFSTIRNEGWGITWNSNTDKLYVSDGSDHIFVWNGRYPFEEEKRFVVLDETGQKIPKLNELEWYKGTILANVWYDDRLLQINPSTGIVMKSWNFKNLVLKKERHSKQDCFNGIALVNGEDDKELYLTGKLWRRVYKVRIPGLMSLE